jgi:hypothetical protein
MRTRVFAFGLCLFGGLWCAVPAEAQYGARSTNANRATGETYHVELGVQFWDPVPDPILISSESLGIIGSNIDFVNQLGIAQTKFRELSVLVRPATKHKFLFEYTPITYDAQKVVTASFVFNGQLYQIGIPVTTEVKWNAYRFGYEWDFLYKNRGFAGLLVDLKYTDIQATLSSAAVGVAQFSHARAPIPAIGAIGRGYIVPNISITGEFSFFKLPDRALNTDQYSGHYYDLNLYGTVNFTDHFGAQVGYRSWDVYYKVKFDTGSMTLKGPYFGAVARF